MQSHLGWYFSFRRDFLFESLTRGLASKDVDQHAQRFVAMIARCTLPCYASKLPISLPSRPNHNAASPPVVDLSAFALSVFARRLAAIT
jgi:hypothetical protein